MKTIAEQPAPVEAHPARATRAALGELSAWGAELLVVKGDITQGGGGRRLGRVRRAWSPHCPTPVLAMPGNHDVWPHERSAARPGGGRPGGAG